MLVVLLLLLNINCSFGATLQPSKLPTPSPGPEVPTPSPSDAPSPAPTESEPPSETPTPAPTLSFNCPYFSVVNSYEATQAYATCSFIACGGSELTISGCNCSGDEYLRLYQAWDDVQVAYDDDYCGSCSYISYAVPGNGSTCQEYNLYEGCWSSGSCSGTVSVTGASAIINSTYSPTAYPVVGPTTSMTCEPYSTTDTNSATQNYATCEFSACGGTTLHISGCGCSTDQYLILTSNGTQVAYDDDYCSDCSYIPYTVPGSTYECANYILQEGCFSDTSCSGTITVSGALVPTVFPTSYPVYPSVRPSPAPSRSPSSNANTPAPTTTYTCPTFSTSDTYSATQNYDTCSFTACGGTTIIANGCACTGDSYLILYEGSTEVTYDDDSTTICGSDCSYISYTVTGSSEDCSSFSLHEGCYSTESCSGTVTVSGVSIVTNSSTPTSYPLVSPSTTLTCAEYSVTNTASDTQNYATCGFSVCGGTTVTVSGGCSCSGDQYLMLYEGSTELTASDDYCGYCSSITYTVSGSSSTCYDLTVREGCFSSNSCSGTVTVTGSSTVAGSPSRSPSAYPILVTTGSPTQSFYCPYYTASNTNSGSQNYDTCSFTACGGTTITANGCGCNGDQYLQLYQGSVEVAYDDDSTYGTCSILSYTVPGYYYNCYTYSLHEGCFGTGSCSGSVLVTGATYAYTVDDDDTHVNSNDDDDSKSYSNGVPTILITGIIVPVLVVSFFIIVGFIVYLCCSWKRRRPLAYITSTHEVELA